MHQHAALWLLAFCLTSLSARFWPVLPGKIWIVLLACIVSIIHTHNVKMHIRTALKAGGRLCGVTNWYVRSKKQFSVLPYLLSGIMSGLIWMASVGHCYLAWQLPAGKIQQDVIVTGQITFTQRNDNGQWLHVALSTLGDRHYFFRPVIGVHLPQNMGELAVHQQVKLTVNLKPASPLMNPDGDSRAKMVSMKMIATGSVKAFGNGSLVSPADSLHYRASKRLQKAGYSRWLVALMTGDRSLLTDKDWQLLQKTGTGHLFSISGLHAGMVALWSALLTSAVISCFARLISAGHNGINIRLTVAVATLLMTALYAALANWQVPVTRAWLLILLLTLLLIFKVCWSWRHRLLMMVILCIIVSPFSVFSNSFYLSAGAVCVLIFIGWRWKLASYSYFHRIMFVIRAQCLISLFLMPFTLIFFGSVSLLTAGVNLIAIPVITLLMPAGLAGLVLNYNNGLPNTLLDLADTILLWMTQQLSVISPYMAAFDNTGVSGQAAFCLLLSMLLLALPVFRYRKRSAMMLAVPAISFWFPFSTDTWQLHVFDVGQGTALAVSRGNRAVIIDTGPSWETGNALTSTVLPALKAAGIHHVDQLIVSHGDDDHAGGVVAWLDRRADHPLELKRSLLSNTNGCQSGKRWRWQGLQFRAMWPEKGNMEDSNRLSCVLLVSGNGHSVLLPGDINRSAEYALLYNNAALNADILLAPHHGSSTSSSMAFIKAVSPSFTVFTSGFYHRWKLPEDVVESRYREAGSVILRTALNGYIQFTLADEGIGVKRYNRDISRRWYDLRTQVSLPQH